MAVSITDLKKELMSRIDTSDLVQVDKVDRYIELTKTFRRMNKLISDEGESVTTVNASQTFTKAHPLIGERNKINASLLNIERSFPEKPKEEKQHGASDLI